MKSKRVKDFEEWLKTRPEAIQQMGKKYPIDCLCIITTRYALQLATPYSYHEDGTYTMTIFRKPFSDHIPNHNVFDLKENDLELIVINYKDLSEEESKKVLELEK